MASMEMTALNSEVEWFNSATKLAKGGSLGLWHRE